MNLTEQFTIPSKKSEAWRYFPTPFFKKQSLTLLPGLSEGTSSYAELPERVDRDGQSNLITFLDGRLTNRVAIDGISMDLTRKPLDTAAYHEDNVLVGLNDAAELLEIRVSKTPASPVLIDFTVSGNQEGLSTPTILVRVEKGVHFELYTRHLGDSDTVFENYVMEFFIADDARLEYLSVKTGQRPMSDSTVYHVGANSFMNASYIAPYTELTRHDIEVYLKGEKTKAYLNGLSILKDEQHFGFKTRVHHQVPECESYQHFKNILTGQGTSEYNGLVEVYRDAQLTDSYQLNRNLILSDSAKAYSRPQLRIFADDVKCSHGSTTGQIQESEILYLMSRGLTRVQAHAILVFGFADEVLESAKCEFAHDEVRALLKESLANLGEIS